MSFHVQVYTCVLSYKYKESNHFHVCLVKLCPTDHRVKGIRVSPPWYYPYFHIGVWYLIIIIWLLWYIHHKFLGKKNNKNNMVLGPCLVHTNCIPWCKYGKHISALGICKEYMIRYTISSLILHPQPTCFLFLIHSFPSAFCMLTFAEGWDFLSVFELVWFLLDLMLMRLKYSQIEIHLKMNILGSVLFL